MSKKYLSLEEAAKLLSISTANLMRMREQGEIRGFADRGNWKFKVDDVETLGRQMNADSNPELPLLEDEGNDLGEQPTVITKGDSDAGSTRPGSDSDVKIIGGPDADLIDDSDSDVKLVGLDSVDDMPTAVFKSDPEIDLGIDSDSDVRLMDSVADESFSDDGGSDSDVKLISDEDDASDVTLMSSEQEAVPVDPHMESVLADDDDSGISLDTDDSSLVGEDSSLMLGGGSGIALEGPTDSGIELTSDDDDEGITLDLGDDSGVSLVSDESGISLDVADESGISLSDEDHSATTPMIDALSDDSIPETQFEIPSLEEEPDSTVFEVESGVLSSSELESSDSVFDLDEESAAELSTSASFLDDDDLDLDEDVFGDDEDLDVFDADDDAFDADEDEEFATRTRGRVGADADWGTGVFAGLTAASLLLLVTGVVMIDLVNNMANAAEPNPISGAILNALSGLYG